MVIFLTKPCPSPAARLPGQTPIRRGSRARLPRPTHKRPGTPEQPKHRRHMVLVAAGPLAGPPSADLEQRKSRGEPSRASARRDGTYRNAQRAERASRGCPCAPAAPGTRGRRGQLPPGPRCTRPRPPPPQRLPAGRPGPEARSGRPAPAPAPSADAPEKAAIFARRPQPGSRSLPPR